MTSSPSGSPPSSATTDATSSAGRSVRYLCGVPSRLAIARSARGPRRPPSSSTRPDVDEPAAEDDAGAVAELRGLVEVVGGEQDRGALGLEAADERPELAARLGVEPRGRLVEEEQLGPADDAEGDVDAATLPARELRDARARLLLEADGGDHLVDVARVRVEPGEVCELLAHRVLARLGRRLQHDAEARLPVEAAVRGVDAEHAHLAGRAQRGSPRGSRSVVDLPAPFGPSRANVSPRAMSRSMPSTAATPP